MHIQIPTYSNWNLKKRILTWLPSQKSPKDCNLKQQTLPLSKATQENASESQVAKVPFTLSESQPLRPRRPIYLHDIREGGINVGWNEEEWRDPGDSEQAGVWA
jgi:hypothetical protein